MTLEDRGFLDSLQFSCIRWPSYVAIFGFFVIHFALWIPVWCGSCWWLFGCRCHCHLPNVLCSCSL